MGGPCKPVLKSASIHQVARVPKEILMRFSLYFKLRATQISNMRSSHRSPPSHESMIQAPPTCGMDPNSLGSQWSPPNGIPPPRICLGCSRKRKFPQNLKSRSHLEHSKHRWVGDRACRWSVREFKVADKPAVVAGQPSRQWAGIQASAWWEIGPADDGQGN